MRAMKSCVQVDSGDHSRVTDDATSVHLRVPSFPPGIDAHEQSPHVVMSTVDFAELDKTKHFLKSVGGPLRRSITYTD